MADFFSFGTNNLAQTTWGFSRDDVEMAFFGRYLELGIFDVSPFETLDREGVGALDPVGRRRRPTWSPQPRPWDLRRTRRRPGQHPLLPPGGAGLRLLLPISGASCPTGSRSSGPRRLTRRA